MKYFGTQTNYLLDIIKPYQRPELRHAEPNDVNREAELDRPSRVACSDLLGVGVILLDPNLSHSPANPNHNRNENGGCRSKNQKRLTPLAIIISRQNAESQHCLQTNRFENK